MKETNAASERSRIKRRPQRGSYDRETIYRILDEGFVCHIGFTVDDQPYVIPTGYARDGDDLLIHGSSASRMMRAMSWETPVSVTVTLIDGIVLARSAFHHSMNYRSVVIFGQAKFVKTDEEKFEALRLFTEQIIPGRWQDVRPPTESELKATTVLRLPIEEASAKIRTGDPVDGAEDYALDIWAGVLPLKMTAGKPISDKLLNEEIVMPAHIFNQKRFGNPFP